NRFDQNRVAWLDVTRNAAGLVTAAQAGARRGARKGWLVDLEPAGGVDMIGALHEHDRGRDVERSQNCLREVAVAGDAFFQELGACRLSGPEGQQSEANPR